MKLLLVILSLAVVVLAESIPHSAFNYHELVGVPEAARIKAAEESFDFDGSRVTGGFPANLGDYPHMGGLIILLTNGFTSMCGSSLLTNTRLVTAAHCWFDGRRMAFQFTVVLGSVRLFSGGTRIFTRSVEMHSHWDSRTANNDVAIISIDHVPFNENINRINLATGTDLFAGTWAVLSGFGRTGDNAEITQDQALKQVSVNVITNDLCAQVFGEYVIESTLCTSGLGGRSPCRGDSGGPLQVKNTMIGIFSFNSIEGCDRGFPAGYARVTNFASWIKERL